MGTILEIFKFAKPCCETRRPAYHTASMNRTVSVKISLALF